MSSVRETVIDVMYRQSQWGEDIDMSMVVLAMGGADLSDTIVSLTRDGVVRKGKRTGTVRLTEAGWALGRLREAHAELEAARTAYEQAVK